MESLRKRILPLLLNEEINFWFWLRSRSFKMYPRSKAVEEYDYRTSSAFWFWKVLLMPYHLIQVFWADHSRKPPRGLPIDTPNPNYGHSIAWCCQHRVFLWEQSVRGGLQCYCFFFLLLFWVRKFNFGLIKEWSAHSSSYLLSLLNFKTELHFWSTFP